MDSEFKERNYEHLLNHELSLSTNIFTPPQPLEGHIGIDAAFLLRDDFWPFFSPLWHPAVRFPPRGVSIRPQLWDFLQRDLNATGFPRFQANIFLQHKVPQYLTTSLASEYQFWNTPYFRYDTEADQQNVLSRLETRLGSDALVAYACPAFWKQEQLFDFANNRQLVENSNFVRPASLNNHHRYSFVSAGTLGLALSEPKDIPPLNLTQEIKRLGRLDPQQDNSNFIKSLAVKINDTMLESSKTIKNNFQKAIQYFGEYDHPLGRSFSQIFSFLFITDISWLIVYQTTNHQS